MNDFFLKNNSDFTPFSLQHLLVVFCCFTLGKLLITWAKKQSIKKQDRIGNIFAFSISLMVVFGTYINVIKDGYHAETDLPLHLCNFMALLLPFISVSKKHIYYEVLLFLILAGTMHSLITPTEYSFLNFAFFRYWYVHAGLIAFMMYATFVYKMRPTLKSVFKAFIGMQAYMLLMFVVNSFLGSNYFYTNRKPNGATLLDVFGDWPNYIFIVELIVIPYFLILYLPFYLTRKKV